MNKKTRKLFTWCLVVALVVTQMLFANVAFAATSYAGGDRYETALKVVKAGWTKSDSAVIARGDDLADALAAAPLAYAKGKAPILLTETATLPAGVLDELVALGVKNVYIVGGTGAVSDAVLAAIDAKIDTVKRLSGADRVATALAVAKEAFPTAPAKAVMVNGYAVADALSISAIAANLGMPILLVDKDAVAADVATYLAGKTVYAVGGTGVISDTVKGTATRLSGADRYATNVEVLKAFTLDYSKVFVAVGEDKNAVDALGGAALAALGNNPIVLVNDALTTAAADLLKSKVTKDTAVFTLGGVVPASVAAAVEACKPTATLTVESVSAINAKELAVKFGTVVDPVYAETAANYTFSAANSDAKTLTVDSATLEDDKQTVTLTLTDAGALNAKTAASYLVRVKNIRSANNEKIAEYSQLVTLCDAAVPTVTALTYRDSNTIKVAFSEPIDATAAGIAGATTVKLNGTTVVVPTAAFTMAASGKYFYIDVVKANFTRAKDYTINIDGIADFAGNDLTEYDGTFNVAIDDVDPEVTEVKALDLDDIKVTFSEKINTTTSFVLKVDGSTTGVGTPAAFNAAAPDGKTFVVHLSTPKADGSSHVITISAFKDLVGNPISKTASKTLEVVFSVTRPAPTSTVGTIKTVGGVNYIVYTFDRDVELNDSTVDAADVSYVDASNITRTLASDLTLKDSDDLAWLGSDQIAVLVDGLALGNYTAKVNYSGDTNIQDVYDNLMAYTKLTFSITSTSIPATVTNAVVNNTNGTVTVTFSNPVGADALETSHYTVGGVKVFESAIFSGAQNIVELTLQEGAITTTGAKSFKVTGIANVTDKAYDGATGNPAKLPFNENVKPVVSKVELISYSFIRLTFSEDVTGVGTDDFEVRVNGQVAGYSITAGSNTAMIDLTTDLTSSTTPVTVKVLSTNNIVDTVNNKMSATTTAINATVALEDPVETADNAIAAAQAQFNADGTLKSTTTVENARDKYDAAKAAFDILAAGEKTAARIDAIANLLAEVAVAEAEAAAQEDLTVTANRADLFGTAKTGYNATTNDGYVPAANDAVTAMTASTLKTNLTARMTAFVYSSWTGIDPTVDTVYMANGNYTKLTAAVADRTYIGGGLSTVVAGVEVTATGVTLQDFRVNGTGVTDTYDISVFSNVADTTIDGLTIDTSSATASALIQGLRLGMSAADAVVENCTLKVVTTGTGSDYIQARLAGTGVTLADNTFYAGGVVLENGSTYTDDSTGNIFVTGGSAWVTETGFAMADADVYAMGTYSDLIPSAYAVVEYGVNNSTGIFASAVTDTFKWLSLTDNSSTASALKITFQAPTGASAVVAQYSADGTNWTDDTVALTAASTSANLAATNINTKTTYYVRLKLTGITGVKYSSVVKIVTP